MSERVDVLVVGAGFAGIGALHALADSGRSVLAIERREAVGGTWYDNVYPGVACDIPSHLYCYSFMPNPEWSRVFAPGAEIRDYLERAAAPHREQIRLGTTMRSAHWTGDSWLVETTTGGVSAAIEAETLVLAAGRLTEPRLPEIPGLDRFDGPVLHTARWDPAVELTGRSVALVGTGASAVQLAPELARVADVTLFQRSAAWVLPRGDRAYSEEERRRFAADPQLIRAIRDEALLGGEAMIPQRLGDLDALDWAQARALAHLHAQVPDPGLRAALMPDDEIGCKRALFSDDYYPALAGGAITLEPSALAAVEPDAGRGGVAVGASGRRHRVDAIVLATGFESTRQPYAPLVRDGRGRTLDEHWANGMTSVASTMVAGFPNLFILDGPNASLGHNSSILMIEAQLDYLSAALAHLDTLADRVLTPTQAAEDAYTARLDAAAAGTVWLTGGCRNWYVDERSGRLTLLWPDSVAAFRERGAHFDPGDFEPAPEAARMAT